MVATWKSAIQGQKRQKQNSRWPRTKRGAGSRPVVGGPYTPRLTGLLVDLAAVNQIFRDFYSAAPAISFFRANPFVYEPILMQGTLAANEGADATGWYRGNVLTNASGSALAGGWWG